MQLRLIAAIVDFYYRDCFFIAMSSLLFCNYFECDAATIDGCDCGFNKMFSDTGKARTIRSTLSKHCQSCVICSVIMSCLLSHSYVNN